MDRREYEQLKQRAEEEFRQNLAAIERVWAIAQANGATSVPGATTAIAAQRAAPRRPRTLRYKGRIATDVRAAIKNLSGTFIFSDVLERLAIEKPDRKVKRGTLKAILKRLCETGELELVTQGIGRKPSQYRRK